eukprot:4891353-Lingulodinium_polyedra.AAC.1
MCQCADAHSGSERALPTRSCSGCSRAGKLRDVAPTARRPTPNYGNCSSSSAAQRRRTAPEAQSAP